MFSSSVRNEVGLSTVCFAQLQLLKYIISKIFSIKSFDYNGLETVQGNENGSGIGNGSQSLTIPLFRKTLADFTIITDFLKGDNNFSICDRFLFE